MLVKGRLSVRDEKAPQILCDSVYPLERDQRLRAACPSGSEARAPSISASPAPTAPPFATSKLVMTMFEGGTPVKIRLADTGRSFGRPLPGHPALLQECREWLGSETS